jgi:hypothetical protein
MAKHTYKYPAHFLTKDGRIKKSMLKQAAAYRAKYTKAGTMRKRK